MKTILDTAVKGQHPVKVEQRTNGRFRVTYGAQVKDNLDYGDAAKEFGECIFHALACDGRMDDQQ